MPFDLKVDQRDAKSGKVVHSDPYRLVITNGEQKFERPPGSGIFYSADGVLIEEPKKAETKLDAAFHSKPEVKK